MKLKDEATLVAEDIVAETSTEATNTEQEPTEPVDIDVCEWPDMTYTRKPTVFDHARYHFDDVVRTIKRSIPRLVWIGDEVDVRIVFTGNPLTPYALLGVEAPSIPQDPEPKPEGKTKDKKAAAKPVEKSEAEHLNDAEYSLSSAGIKFDTGYSLDGRNWFFDYSLRGPVRVKFVSKAKKPEKRTG